MSERERERKIVGMLLKIPGKGKDKALVASIDNHGAKDCNDYGL